MITFVVTAHQEEYDMYMFIGSLLKQTNQNWKCIIYHNGSSEEEYMNFNDRCNQILKYEYRVSDKFKLVSSEKNNGYWGTLNRQDALERLVDTKFIINTSIQDYWQPKAVEEILKHENADMIYWNAINHIFGYHGILSCEPVIGRIDWGNFAVKTDIAQKVGINKPKEFCADGYFVQDLLNSGLIKSKVKIPQVLTIHN